MLFKSQLITVGSGKVNGLVASHNKGGNYFRGLSIPTNPSTAAQVAQRARMQTISTRWINTLTPAQRAAWIAYAPTVIAVNKLGETIQLSGQNVYIQSNTVLLQAGGTIVDAAPATSAQPSFDLSGSDVDNLGEITFNIAATGNDWAAEDGAFLLVSISRDISVGRNFFKGPFQFADVIAGNSTTPPSGNQMVTSPFSHGAGSGVFLRYRVVTVDGRLSAAEIIGPGVVS